tara:strand:- start:1117 stop:1371 length:255 start_codon:yes stop_codon:yes gene_type:complete
MKKNCVEIKKMKGNISYNKDGALRKVNIKGVKNEVSDSFKKVDSSIKLIIKTKIKKTIETKKIFFKNFFSRYCLCIFNINLISP